ncbi:ATPase [Erythrobacter sp.]|nr:ATPase [Erythrobacter sp.]
MPQIDQLDVFTTSQIFWTLIFFGITFFLIGRGMVPKVMGTVALRDKQISDDLAAAQGARDAADEQEEAWRERENENRANAQALIAEAKASGAAKSEKKLSAAQKRLDTKLAKAEAEIETARVNAMAEVEDVAAEATQDILVRLAGTKVDKRSARAAVKKALAHV